MVTKTKLKQFAHLIAKVGLNVQKGQEVEIFAGLDQPEFVKLVVDECYRAGAKKVHVNWSYQPLTKSHVKYQKLKDLSAVEAREIAQWQHIVDEYSCRLFLESDDPDGLSGVDLKKYAAANRARKAIIKPYRDKIENKHQWCIVGVPGKEWAKKVFPNDRVSVAVDKLWDVILKTTRVWDDPVAAWEEHNKNLADKCDKLNRMELRELCYRSVSSGTDFRVGLNPEVLFAAGGEYSQTNHAYFNPNMPTEEVFTSPMKGRAEGIVYSSMPLSYDGQLIDKFWIRFHEGRAVEVGAEKNEELLREIISMDEGAAYLGECAIVPYDSPIRQSGVLFYNTLFDENAACHLALGVGFTGLLRGFENMTEKEAFAHGINDSMIHEDFMIGTADLEIVGIDKNGKRITILKDGNWAI